MSGVLRELRDLVPIRPLTWVEALQVAERQATRFLELSGVAGPAVPDEIITGVPRVQVERITPSPVAGATEWSKGRWLIVINGGDIAGRQRFSLAHEFKHIVDHPFVKVLYPPIGALSTHDRRESICDYFAGCLLMPRPWVKKAWHEIGQDSATLARVFDVSRQAMQVRLNQIGLAEPMTRCGVAVGAGGSNR